MSANDYTKFSDEDLLAEAKKIKPSPVFDAFFIGFLVGIIVFSVAVNTWGLVTLIPLYLIYLFLKKGKNHKALQEEIKKRKLK